MKAKNYRAGFLAFSTCVLVHSASAQVSYNTTFTFDAPVPVGPSQAPNIWYPDRYAPSAFESFDLSGENVLRLAIDAVTDGSAGRGGQSGSFYNTQGRKLDLPPSSYALEASLYVPTSWLGAADRRRSDLWATAVDGSGSITGYPIIGVANVDGSPVIRYWTDAGWVVTAIPVVGDSWYHFEMILTGEQLTYMVNGVEAGTTTFAGTTRISDTIVQAYNFNDPALLPAQQSAASYDAYWDNLGIAHGVIQNVTQNTFHNTLGEAIAAATAGDVIQLGEGNYHESPVNVNKAVTILGPNSGIPGSGARSGEARLVNTPLTITSSGAALDGLEIYQTDNASNAILIQADAAVENSIIRRNGTVVGQPSRGITTAVGLSGVTISGNLFTGDPSGGFFSGHKSWNSGIYSNGGSATISGNTFENCRTAMNLDDFNAGMNLTGNQFRSSGTYLSFGGVTPTNGSYSLTGNDFDINLASPGLPSAFFNNSNVAATFRIDATSSTFGGVATTALTSADKFAIEARVLHRGRSNKNGVIDYVPGQQIEVAGTTLQSAIDAANAGDTVLIGGNITLTSPVTVGKQLTFDGDNKATSKISGSNALASYFMLFSGSSAGSVIQNLSFEKTDKAGVQNLIGLQAPNITFQNCDFTGQYVLGDPDVSRAFEISSGANDFSILNCSVIGLRQPAYINAVTSGLIQNTYVAGTRGWVVDGGLVTFTGNTWGVGPAANAVDIALLASTPYSSLYDPLATLSANNNGATISNQRISVQVVNLTQGSGYPTIQSAVIAATAGDILEAYAGTFNEAVSFGKSLTLRGPNHLISPNSGIRGPEAILTGSLAVDTGVASTVVIEGFHFKGASAPFTSNGSAPGSVFIFQKNLVDTGSAQVSIFTNNASNDLTAVIDDNRLAGMTGNAIQIAAIAGSAISTTITNNVIDGTGTAGINSDSITNSTISGNTFSNTGQQGLQLAGSCSNVTVSANIFNNSNTSNGTDRGAIRIYGSGFTGAVNVTGNVITGGNNGFAVRSGEDISGKDIHFAGNSLSGVNGTAVRHGGIGTLDATGNYWGDPDGPAGTPSLVSGDVSFNPWYGSSNHALPLVLSDLRTGILNDIQISTPETYTDLYIAPGTTVTVTPTGSLGADKLELANGAELVVNEGDLSIGDDTVISGTFTIFNSFGSWNINGNTTFNIGQSLALISDVHVAAGKTLTVNGGGELILDGCVIDSQTPGSPYNIVAAADGVLTMARNVVSDADIDINTVNGSVPANVISRIYDNSFATSDIEATADAKVYHNLFDGATNSAANTANTAAFATVDGWGNITDANLLQNKLTLDFDAPVDPSRTLDADGNLFVQSNDAIAMRVDVSALGSNGITAAEALLGYNSNMLSPTGTPTVVDPEGIWQVIAESTSLTPPSSLGMVDSALGLQLASGQPGSSADETIARVTFTASAAGQTLGFFRVQNDRVFDGNGILIKDTRLTKSVAGLPSYLAAFTANTGELIIDNEEPEILAAPITGTQVQPSQAAPVNVLNTANPVFRTSEPLVLTFSATDNGHGLSGIDASDTANDLVLYDVNSSAVINPAGYTVSTTDVGGVVTYVVSLDVPAVTPAGVYPVAATVQDRSGNVSPQTTLGSFIIANEAQVNVELQGFTGTTRDVTFVATGGTPATWTKTITNFVGGSGFAILENVPVGTTSISAKTAWTLRSKVTASFTPAGVGTANLTGTDQLKAGDITGDNVVNTLDYSVLRFNWLTAAPVSDIDGSGGTNVQDYNLLKANFYTAGSAQ